MGASMKPDVAGAKGEDRRLATVTRWIAALAIGLLTLNIVRNLIRSPTPYVLTTGLVRNAGVLLVMTSLLVTNRRVQMALAIGGALIITAAFLVHYL
jgi:hypothetical protein